MMMMSRLAPTIFLRAILPIAFGLALGLGDPDFATAQDRKPDPIDRALDECLDGPQANTTVGQVECLTTAYKAWDDELNSVYKRLMKKLDPASADQLKNTQRLWIDYRDAEMKFQSGPWSDDKGSIMQIIRNSGAVDLVRDRVMALRGTLALEE